MNERWRDFKKRGLDPDNSRRRRIKDSHGYRRDRRNELLVQKRILLDGDEGADGTNRV